MPINIEIQLRNDKEALRTFERLSEEERKRQAAFERANAAYRDTERRLRELRKRLSEVSQAGSEAFDAAEVQRLKKEIESLEKNTSKFGKGLKDNGGALSGFTQGLKRTALLAAAAFAVEKVKEYGQKIVEITAKFRKLEAVLGNTLGDRSAAQRAFSEIVAFASQTPFQVDELTESFVKLANQGFVPTTEELRRLGDLAASTGKSFDQLAEAVIDAQVGEFERLKEFGIQARQSGEEVIFTFRGVQTAVENNSEAIRAYLLGLGELQGVSGSMAAISETLAGKLSNLEDNITRLANALGQRLSSVTSGALDALNGLLDSVTDFFEVSYAEQLQAEREELNLLVETLTEANLTTEQRKVLIDEITAKYPDFVKQIDLNTASEEELRQAMQKTNEEYNKRIFIASLEAVQRSYDEEYAALVKTVARGEVELRRLRKSFDQSSGGVSIDLPFIDDTEADKYNALREELREARARLKELIDEREQAIKALEEEFGLSRQLLSQEQARQKAEQERRAQEQARQKEQEAAARRAAQQAEALAKKQAEARREAAAFELREIEARREAMILETRLNIEELKKRLSDESLNEAERIELLKRMTEERLVLLGLETNRRLQQYEIDKEGRLRVVRLTATEEQNILREQAAAERAIYEELTAEISRLRSESARKALQAGPEAALSDFENQTRSRLAALNAQQLEASSLNEFVRIEKEKEAVLEEAELKRLLIKQKYIREALNNERLSKESSASLKASEAEITEQIENKKLAILKKKLEEAEQAEREAAARRRQIYEESLSFGQSLVEASFEFRNLKLEEEAAALQEKKEYELSLYEDNAQARQFVEQRAAAQEAAIRRRKAQAEKEAALFRIAIDTAKAVIRAIADSTSTFGLPYSAFAIAQGAIQAALVRARPLPKFRHGVEFFDGVGSETSDSNLALLSRGERVVSAKTNKMYYPVLSAIHHHRIKPEVLNSIATGKVSFEELSSRLDLIASKLDRPGVSVNMDKEGFGVYLESELARKRVLNRRYSL